MQVSHALTRACCAQAIAEETTRNWITIRLNPDNVTLQWSEPNVDQSQTTRKWVQVLMSVVDEMPLQG